MRPTKLTITGFGPYATKQVLDMDKLGTNGLYLITGDTGAGKTTVFDAICYALYGEPSGENRKTEMLRSNYADKNTPTEVELEFEYRGKKYTVKRNPAYERAKQRGEGTTKEIANAELTLPDGKIISQDKKVTAKIVELLGVDEDQFKQVAMIAQGEFRKLIQADSTERRKIFQKLFNTSRYERIESELKERAREASDNEKKVRESYNANVKNVQARADMANNWDFVKTNTENSEAVVNMTRELIKADETEEIHLGEQIKETDERLTALSVKLADAKRKKEDAQKLENEKSALTTMDAELETLEQKCTDAQKREGETDGMKAQAAQIEAQLGEYAKLADEETRLNADKTTLKKKENDLESGRTSKKNAEERQTREKESFEALKDAPVRVKEAETALEKANVRKGKLDELLRAERELATLGDKISDSEKNVAELGKNLEDKKAEIERLKQELETLKDCDANLEKKNGELDKLGTRGQALVKLSWLCDKYKTLAQTAKDKIDNNEKIAKAFEAQQKEYDALEQAYLSGQAALLAEKLEEGTPCPVCGSIHHPSLAVRAQNVPDKATLEKVKENLDYSRTKKENAFSDAETAKATAELALNNMLTEADALLTDFERNYVAVQVRIIEEQKEHGDAFKALNAEIDRLKSDCLRKQQLDTLIPQREKQRDALADELNTLNSKLSGLRGKKESDEQTFNNNCAELLGEGEQLADAVKRATKELADAQTALQKADADEKERARLENDLSKIAEEIKKFDTAIAELEKDCAGLTSSISVKSEELEKRRGQLMFPTEADAKKRINALNAECEKIKNAIADAQNAVTDKKEAINAAKGRVEQLIKNINDNAVTESFDELNGQIQASQNKKEEAKKAQSAVAARRLNNEGCLKGMIKCADELVKLSKRRATLATLSEIANGTKAGSLGKLSLETYVQTAYFDRIIDFANRRFRMMSDNQYELRRREVPQDKRLQTGLDLDVLDHFNGTTRQIGSLSGGEGFLAALSLALGLSDEIQASAGGIQLDTLFIDEGFGSLDPDKLDKVMKALDELTEGNRLIGIISHVDELKRRVEKQIVVTHAKNDQGSTAKIKTV